MKKKLWRICIPLISVLVLAVGTVIRISEIPDRIFLSGGGSRTLEFHLPFSAKIRADAVDVVKFNGTSLKDEDVYSMDRPLVMTTESGGNTSIQFDLFGILPIKRIDVTVGEERMLYPGGQSIGVMLRTRGALVVGSMAVETRSGEVVNPARIAGLNPGDIICEANGIRVEDSDRLAEIVAESDSHRLELLIERGGVRKTIRIEAVPDREGSYKLGVWVRDSTAGVGTLTFYEPETGVLAGLGHAITDVDTGTTLQVENGEIILSEITEVIKGQEGSPGELHGVFDPQEEVIGYITKNTDYGIYGSAGELPEGLAEPVPAASQDEVREGDAVICCSVDDGGVQEYSCRIENPVRQNRREQKSFVVVVTDERLLSRTGGIVQGMSGSPILQNGKLIGAVTHVLVNDPTRGYGIYIDWMLEEIE